MNSFRFVPELLEVRSDVISFLDDQNFHWLSHYSAVDPAHDVHGIEVCGIQDRNNAEAILECLIRMFPNWYDRQLYYKDWSREEGWKVKISRDGPDDSSPNKGLV